MVVMPPVKTMAILSSLFKFFFSSHFASLLHDISARLERSSAALGSSGSNSFKLLVTRVTRLRLEVTANSCKTAQARVSTVLRTYEMVQCGNTLVFCGEFFKNCANIAVGDLLLLVLHNEILNDYSMPTSDHKIENDRSAVPT